MKTYELITPNRDNRTYYRHFLNIFRYLDNYILLCCISNFMSLHYCLEQIIIMTVREQCVLSMPSLSHSLESGFQNGGHETAFTETQHSTITLYALIALKYITYWRLTKMILNHYVYI